VGQHSTDTTFSVRRSSLDATLTYSPHKDDVVLQLLDANGQLIATLENGRLKIGTLACGTYVLRIIGSVAKPIDFTIRIKQG